MKAIKRFYVYYQHHLAGKTTVWARKPSFARQREKGERDGERGRAQQRPLFAGVQFRYGRHLKRTSSSSFRLPRKNDSEREGERRRQIPISGPESPEHKRHRMWQSDMLICCWITFSLSLLRTLAMHFNYAHFRVRCGRVRQLPHRPNG